MNVARQDRSAEFDPSGAVLTLIPPRNEWEQRVHLAACYRLADRYRMGKVIWNHITARVPDANDQLLVFRLDCRYDEVTASNLLKISLEGSSRRRG